jgi:energy-converting hydrogenase Eha subunit A
MSYNIVFNQGTATVSVPAGEKIVVQSYSPTSVFQEVGYPNFPETNDLLSVVENTTYTSAAFSAATTVIIQAGASGANYAVGVAPVISDDGNWQLQGAPADIADGGSMIATAANVLTGIVTSTITQARSLQLPTGANLDLATEWAIGEAFDCTFITLGAFVLTITVNTGVTIVGAATTAATAGSTARFRLRKTAADTFIAYRIS